MHNFLTDEFRPLATITSPLSGGACLEDTPVPYSDVSYTGDHTEPRLGYDYGAGDEDIERGYRYAICYWMAINGGQLRNGKPFMIYDGCEEWSICKDGPTCTCSATLHTDTIGYRKLQPLMLAERMAKNHLRKWLTKDSLSELNVVDAAVQQELMRLSALWRQTL